MTSDTVGYVVGSEGYGEVKLRVGYGVGYVGNRILTRFWKSETVVRVHKIQVCILLQHCCFFSD